MSGGSSNQPVTQTAQPVITPQAQQLYNLAMPGIQQFAAKVPERYPGPTVAPFTEQQTAGQQAMIEAAYGAGGTVAPILTGGAQTAAGISTGQGLEATPGGLKEWVPGAAPELQASPFGQSFWDPNYNAALGSAIEAAQRPLYQRLQEEILPNIRSGAIQTGGFGGSRQGIAEGLAAGRTQQAAGDIASKMAQETYGANLAAALNRYNENQQILQARYATDVQAEQQRQQLNRTLEAQRYQANLEAQLKSLGLIPGLTQGIAGASMLGPTTQTAVGEQEQALNQAILTGQINAWNYDQLAPYLQSKELMSLAQGFPIGQTTTANAPQPNTAMSAMGGGLAGASLGATLGSAVPGVGTLAGAGVGALGGAALPFLFR